MKKLLTLCSVLLFVISVFAQTKASSPVIHAMNDVSHSYTFHGDWGFHKQYLQDQKYAKSWCALYHSDLSNANLLFLNGCEDQLTYVPKDIEKIQSFLKEGGGVMILGNPKGKSQNELAKLFGGEFKKGVKDPLHACKFTTEPVIVKANSAYLELQNPQKWTIVVADAEKKPLLAYTKVGKGMVILGARALMGDHPDHVSDSINSTLWRPLWNLAAQGKKVNPAKAFNDCYIETLEHRQKEGTIDVSYSDYMQPYADKMFDIAGRCKQYIEPRMGVPLSSGMASRIVLIPTGGGGYSSGEILALSIWWGGFPDKEESMIEFITHETVHSWVRPFAEIWNEPIATYVGNLVMADMGYPEESVRRIKKTIESGRKYDPEYNQYDLEGKSWKEGVKAFEGRVSRDLHWGKTFWIFEQLRAENPTFIADYFKAKRRYATPELIKKYDVNNTVAIVSIAMKRDMFPWFKSIGFDVNRERSEVKESTVTANIDSKGAMQLAATIY